MNDLDNNNGLNPRPTRLDVDADGIPILNEVVEFAPLEAEARAVDAESAPPAATIDPDPSPHERMGAAVRSQLKSQLQDALPGLIEQATAAAVAQVTASLECQIRDHLNQTLEARLSQLIDESVDRAD